MNRQYILLAGVAVTSATLGAVGSFFGTRHLLETKYAKVYELEVEVARKYYAKLNKRDEFSDPTLLVSPADEVSTQAYHALSKYQGQFSEEPLTVVLDESDDDYPPVGEREFDYEFEVGQRTDFAPYIITKEEFFEAEDPSYDQVTLTYFEEDDVLIDEQDTPIPDTDDLVGDNHLRRFGEGSGDKNVIYIRNPQKRLEFEILLNQRSYAKEVLGFIEHSDSSRRPRKFRRDYE